MTTVEIELPEATAQAAKAAGLLTPQALDRLLSNALRKREAVQSLRSIADDVAAAGIAPMTMEEIDAEVKAVRAELSYCPAQRSGNPDDDRVITVTLT